MGYAGQISLGQAAFYDLGSYSSAILTVKFFPWLSARMGRPELGSWWAWPWVAILVLIMIFMPEGVTVWLVNAMRRARRRTV